MARSPPKEQIQYLRSGLGDLVKEAEKENENLAAQIAAMRRKLLEQVETPTIDLAAIGSGAGAGKSAGLAPSTARSRALASNRSSSYEGRDTDAGAGGVPPPHPTAVAPGLLPSLAGELQDMQDGLVVQSHRVSVLCAFVRGRRWRIESLLDAFHDWREAVGSEVGSSPRGAAAAAAAAAAAGTGPVAEPVDLAGLARLEIRATWATRSLVVLATTVGAARARLEDKARAWRLLSEHHGR